MWKRADKEAKKTVEFESEEAKKKALEDAERRGQELVENFRKMMNERLNEATRHINTETEKHKQSSDNNKRKDKSGGYER